MPLNFIELWAERKPARRWPVVIAGLVLTILAASSIDFYTERAQFHARCTAAKRLVVPTTDGDLACVKPQGATT